MKSFTSKLTIFSLILLIILCYSCDTNQQTVTDTTVNKPTTKPMYPLKTAEEPSIIVAQIGDYNITKKALEEKLKEELLYAYELDKETTKPIEPRPILLEMIAEKAMIMEARKLNYLKDEYTSKLIKEFRNNKLVGLLLATHLQDKLEITESQIDEKIKADSKLNRSKAENLLRRDKATELIAQYYNKISEKRNIKKYNENLSKTAQLYQRLLSNPRKEGGLVIIQLRQVIEDLTQQEKSIVLATFDGGKVTVKDWFYHLCEMSPPSRPKDLNTAKGVEQLLDNVIKTPLFAAEAESLGLDKDKSLLAKIREKEDLTLLRTIQQEKVKGIQTLSDQDKLIAYFNNNKEKFRHPHKLQIDQIWCTDLKTAQEVREKLNEEDFESIKQKYSLSKENKPTTANRRYEGTFFDQMWKGDPNEIIGPIKGLHKTGLRWRIVKILTKTPGKIPEYSEKMDRNIQNKMWYETREKILANFRKEMLTKYSYKISPENLKDIDPLKIE